MKAADHSSFYSMLYGICAICFCLHTKKPLLGELTLPRKIIM